MKRARHILTGLLLTMATAAQATDTGNVVEHLYHHTYLVQSTQRTCLPEGWCYTTLGAPHLVYDETLADRLELRCDDDDDACQYFEQESEQGEEELGAFAPKPIHWENSGSTGRQGPA